MLKGWDLLRPFMENWEYLDWLALTNILLAGLCFDYVIIESIKTMYMEDVSSRVLEKIKNI